MRRFLVLGCLGTVLGFALAAGAAWALWHRSWFEAAFMATFAYMVAGSVLRDFERARTPRGD